MDDGIAITNDDMHWPAMERLRSNTEYQDWCDRIPDHASWARPQTDEPLPNGVDFAVHDYLVIPLPKKKDPSQSALYSPTVRLRGNLVILDNFAVETGEYAQTIAIQKTAMVLFARKRTAPVVDILVLGFSLAIPVAFHVRSVRRAGNHRMHGSGGGERFLRSESTSATP